LFNETPWESAACKQRSGSEREKIGVISYKRDCPCPQLLEVQTCVTTKPVHLTLNLSPTTLALSEMAAQLIVAEFLLLCQCATALLCDLKIFIFSIVSIEVEEEGGWLLRLRF
jgi:hypothetical protein